MPASMQGIRVYIINVGSMLARPELVGMQEPRIVGQARVKFPHLFLCRYQNQYTFINFIAESGNNRHTKLRLRLT